MVYIGFGNQYASPVGYAPYDIRFWRGPGFDGCIYDVSDIGGADAVVYAGVHNGCVIVRDVQHVRRHAIID